MFFNHLTKAEAAESEDEEVGQEDYSAEEISIATQIVSHHHSEYLPGSFFLLLEGKRRQTNGK